MGQGTTGSVRLPDPSKADLRVPIMGYIALVLAFIFFSGIFNNFQGAITAMDYTTITGKFGVMANPAKATYRGQGGFGVREGFLFAFGIIPGMMLALGVINVVDHIGGLKAARRLLTPILRPILGIPGVASLAMVGSFQSSDGGAAMTKALYDEGEITNKERAIFIAFQFSAGSPVDNFLSTGAALFAFLTVPMMIPFGLLFVMKIFGANIMRLYLARFVKDEELS